MRAALWRRVEKVVGISSGLAGLCGFVAPWVEKLAPKLGALLGVLRVENFALGACGLGIILLTLRLSRFDSAIDSATALVAELQPLRELVAEAKAGKAKRDEMVAAIVAKLDKGA